MKLEKHIIGFCIVNVFGDMTASDVKNGSMAIYFNRNDAEKELKKRAGFDCEIKEVSIEI